jgi:hypothetical protein
MTGAPWDDLIVHELRIIAFIAAALGCGLAWWAL